MVEDKCDKCTALNALRHELKGLWQSWWLLLGSYVFLLLYFTIWR